MDKFEVFKKKIKELEEQLAIKPCNHSWKAVTAEGGVMAFFMGKVNIYMECRKCHDVKVV